jgi:hypothetical protein
LDLYDDDAAALDAGVGKSHGREPIGEESLLSFSKTTQ